MAAELRQLQLCILDVALEFKRICEKYDINYFLIGGSLLGAVRHKGFIPWDDDMDVGMLREDYEKFVKICSRELDEDYFFQDYHTDKYYNFGYSKIRIKGTDLLEDYTADSKQGKGIFLDIFPFDDMPNGVVKKRVHYLLFKCIKWGALGKADYKFVTPKKRRFAKVMSAVFFPFSRESILRLEDNICAMFHKEKASYAINMQGAYNYKEYTKKDNLVKTDRLSFEGYEFSVPSNYDELLTQMYGDYMTLPPVEKRGRQHQIINMDMGNYVIRNSAAYVRENDESNRTKSMSKPSKTIGGGYRHNRIINFHIVSAAEQEAA